MSLVHRQTTGYLQQLRKDVAAFRIDIDNFNVESASSTISISLIGAITTRIASIGRLLDDYQNFISNLTAEDAKNQNQKKYEKLKNDYDGLRNEFQELFKRREELLRQSEQIRRENERNNLFSEAIASGTDDNPYSAELRNSRRGANQQKEDRFDDSTGNMMDQQMKLDRGNARLDEILEMGRAAFDDIVEQNEMLLKVKDRMSQGLETLGVSHRTVMKIEKVMWEDKVIFYVLASLTLFIMWVIWHYLG